MNRYNVIWFDDEHTSLTMIKEKAHLNGIDLCGFDNAKDGIEELERNILKYDAAIVDAMFFVNSEQKNKSVSNIALLNVVRAFESLKNRKKLPWFVLSGQVSFTQNQHELSVALELDKVYDKMSDEDISSLFETIFICIRSK